jgi:hypothetical protein
MMSEQSPKEFTADDLAMVPDAETPADAGNDAASDKSSEQEEVKPAETQKPSKERSKSIVESDDDDAEDKSKQSADEKADKPSDSEVQDWREEIAKHYAAGDDKAFKRELKRLERISDVKSIWGMYRELESKFTSGGLVKIPGKDAKPEDIAAFHKAMGVPEKPEEYFKDIKLENGAVIGEADKPLADAFAQAVHKVGAPPAVVNAAMNWYFQHQEEQAAALDEADDEFKSTSISELKDEYGAGFKRMSNSVRSLFATAPGGSDIENDQSLISRVLGGRTADGKVIGNDPQIFRWLVGMAQEINPSVTVVEDGDQSGQSIEDEIKTLEKRMKDDRRGYFKDEAAQARYRDLLTARDKIRARA